MSLDQNYLRCCRSSHQAYNTAYALDVETWEWRALRNSQGPRETSLSPARGGFLMMVMIFIPSRTLKEIHFCSSFVQRKGSANCPSPRYFVASFEHLGALYAWGGRSSQQLCGSRNDRASHFVFKRVIVMMHSALVWGHWILPDFYITI